eukprot:764663-Prymnesium_polylepis.1
MLSPISVTLYSHTLACYTLSTISVTMYSHTLACYTLSSISVTLYSHTLATLTGVLHAQTEQTTGLHIASIDRTQRLRHPRWAHTA